MTRSKYEGYDPPTQETPAAVVARREHKAQIGPSDRGEDRAPGHPDPDELSRAARARGPRPK